MTCQPLNQFLMETFELKFVLSILHTISLQERVIQDAVLPKAFQLFLKLTSFFHAKVLDPFIKRAAMIIRLLLKQTWLCLP